MKIVSNRVVQVSVIVVLAAVIFLFPLYAPGRWLHLAIIGLTGAITAMGLNIFYGYCGQISFGHAGFFAIGGYGVALLERDLNMPFFPGLILAIVAAGLVAWLVSFSLLRLRHYLLGLGTLAFGLAVHTAVSKGFVGYTGGEDGISLSYLEVFGAPAGDEFFYILLVILTALCFWISHTLRNSRVGRGWVSIARDMETVATSVGVDITGDLRRAFIVSGMMTASVGGVFVKWMAWCSPAYFDMMRSTAILLGVVVGGTGSALGAVIGGLIMFMLDELLVPLALYHILSYGIILCGVLLFMPGGIVGGIRALVYRFRPPVAAPGRG